jgi:CRP-like cAMP-binding protein
MTESLEAEWLDLLRDVNDTLGQIQGGESHFADGDHAWLEGLRHSPNFSRLSANKLAAMLLRLEEVRTSAGDVVIRQKDEGDYFYIIKSGSVTVSQRKGPGEIEIVNQLHEGDTFGESALVSGEGRNASIVADTACVLLRLAKDDFNALVRTDLVRHVSAREAEALAANGARFLDVRRNNAERVGGFAGAMGIPIDQLRDRLDELDRETPYLLYCHNGVLSETAAVVLGQKGYQVSVVKDGLKAIR